MTFVNEAISEVDIEQYRLSIEPDDGRFWTVDKERNIYLRGGARGNPAFGEEIYFGFDLCVCEEQYYVKLNRGKGSVKYTERPYLVVWDSIIDITPHNLSSLKELSVIEILKEALSVWGEDGRENEFAPAFVVQFNF